MNITLLLLAIAGVGLTTWGTLSRRTEYRHSVLYWFGIALIVGCIATYAIHEHQLRRIASIEGSVLKSDMVSNARSRMLPGGGN